MPDAAINATERQFTKLLERAGVEYDVRIRQSNTLVAASLLAIYLQEAFTWLFWPMAASNAVMIAATPIFGGHFFVDVLAGAVIFWISVRISGWLISRSSQAIGISVQGPLTATAAGE
jgi:membrane-associated phospholipid phosphatase